MTGETQCAWAVRHSPVGPLLLAATGAGLVTVGFRADEGRIRRALGRLAGELGADPVHDERHPVLSRAAAELDAYFEGRLRAFGLPLDWSLVSGFTRQVLRELAASVPFGSVLEYGELARRVGDPGAARAVGAAMGANPLPVVVPCHRVVAAGGSMGGFSGGLETKRVLLAHEGVLPAPLF
ncbi:methylated-DNA--[protein]-cysteine S-methyltransferase [Streptomyces johnsoniae]|uniref:Methylated-DNA--protein-cysteine methyltransferase n=1 Tax=Streptomyces johnsoniae TaxID=3075532 RepID=A0ABU2S7L8_9ACTN|nr:methylated-DNA--[protein]-cysteine S-methyltransferase [Streptomyces sp. DSM 41886]MDT0444925.1 methylated-DNA--[protein]-cysteine S-methyltransferase [Streptomyces sp. DSM 41886]